MQILYVPKFTLGPKPPIKDWGPKQDISWLSWVKPSHREKNWVSTVHHVGVMKCQTREKKDTFWKNIPPGKFDPYGVYMGTYGYEWV